MFSVKNFDNFHRAARIKETFIASPSKETKRRNDGEVLINSID